MDPCAQLPINRHTTCKICGKMTHNGTAGYQRSGQNAQILNLTSEMNFLCQITYKTTSNMLICGKMTHNVTVGFQRAGLITKLPINRHTTCKKCSKMAHNVMFGCQRAGQNAPMSILTSEMNSLSQFCYSLMYHMQLLF